MQADRAIAGMPDFSTVGGAAWIDPARCQGCGTCTVECPARAIQLLNYLDEQMMCGLGKWEVSETVEVSR